MEYIVVCLVTVVVSGLTPFSGFGLGTVLMPAFALFFPVPVAVAATAVVHLANNLFKVFLVGRKADWPVVLRFALPGAVTAMLGAALLNLFANIPPAVDLSALKTSRRCSAGSTTSSIRSLTPCWKGSCPKRRSSKPKHTRAARQPDKSNPKKPKRG